MLCGDLGLGDNAAHETLPCFFGHGSDRRRSHVDSFIDCEDLISRYTNRHVGALDILLADSLHATIAGEND